MRVVLTVRLATGYPGRNVCVIFIGVVFVIGFGSAMVAQCISLEARNLGKEFGQTALVGEFDLASLIIRVSGFQSTWHLTDVCVTYKKRIIE